MSTDTFKPAKMSEKVAALTHLGQYLGFRGAIGRALKAHLRATRKGSPGDAMVLANVFYSAAGNMLASGIIYRPLAPLFSFLLNGPRQKPSSHKEKSLHS